MLIQLLFTSILDFSLSIFGAFVFFSAGLLYLDAWQLRLKHTYVFARAVGFFIFSSSYILHATNIQSGLFLFIIQTIKIIGLILIFTSLINEPITKRPKPVIYASILALLLPMTPINLSPVISTLLLVTGIVFYIKATDGLEIQLKPISVSFILLGLFEIINIAYIWSNTNVIFWSKFLANFGPLWTTQHFLEFIALTIMFIWVWSYARFRIQVQLFVSTVAMSTIIFLFTTTVFTALLMQNIQRSALTQLSTDVKIFQYSIETLKEKSLSSTQTIAKDSNIVQGLTTGNKKTLQDTALSFMLSQKIDSLLIATSSGEIITRAEDPDRVSDKLTDDQIKSITGQENVSFTYNKLSSTPEVNIQSVVPITKSINNQSKVFGSVLSSFTINNSFLDSVKERTGLDASIYGDNNIVATTLTSTDGKSRFIGSVESNESVVTNVLKKGEPYERVSNIHNVEYLLAYSPLKDNSNNVIGMISVGKPQSSLINTVKKSLEYTILGSITLIVLTIIPAYFFSRQLAENLEA